jgi:hypothetical protein
MSRVLGLALPYVPVTGISAMDRDMAAYSTAARLQLAPYAADRPALQTLAGIRNAQPNIALHLWDVDDDGVVHDGLGNAPRELHDGHSIAYAGAASSGVPYQRRDDIRTWRNQRVTDVKQRKMARIAARVRSYEQEAPRRAGELKRVYESVDPSDRVAVQNYMQAARAFLARMANTEGAGVAARKFNEPHGRNATDQELRRALQRIQYQYKNQRAVLNSSLSAADLTEVKPGDTDFETIVKDAQYVKAHAAENYQQIAADLRTELANVTTHKPAELGRRYQSPWQQPGEQPKDAKFGASASTTAEIRAAFRIRKVYQELTHKGRILVPAADEDDDEAEDSGEVSDTLKVAGTVGGLAALAFFLL